MRSKDLQEFYKKLAEESSHFFLSEDTKKFILKKYPWLLDSSSEEKTVQNILLQLTGGFSSNWGTHDFSHYLKEVPLILDTFPEARYMGIAFRFLQGEQFIAEDTLENITHSNTWVSWSLSLETAKEIAENFMSMYGSSRVGVIISAIVDGLSTNNLMHIFANLLQEYKYADVPYFEGAYEKFTDILEDLQDSDDIEEIIAPMTSDFDIVEYVTPDFTYSDNFYESGIDTKE